MGGCTFAQHMSKTNGTYYTANHRFTGMVMMLLLLWLTVSMPFAFAQQEQKKVMQANQQTQADNTNPLANTNEEIPESGTTNFSEEYLHEQHDAARHFIILGTYYKCHKAGFYINFHPELFSPPPEQPFLIG